MRFELALLIDSLEEILINESEYSEFALLQKLQSPSFGFFTQDALSDNLGLFQTHFTLFHALYKLQQRWLQERVGYLSVTALKIKLHREQFCLPVDDAEVKIRDYYLDFTQLSQTNEQDVESLLDSFWEKFGNIKYWQIPDSELVSSAFDWFGLPSECHWREVKSRYYQTLHLNHPDKGGDIAETQKAMAHYDVLKRHFRCLESI